VQPNIELRQALGFLGVLAMAAACGTSEVVVEVPAGFTGIVVLVSDHSESTGRDLEIRVPITGACRIARLPNRSAMRVCEQTSGGCIRLPLEPGNAGERHVFGSKVGNRGGVRRDDRKYYMAFAVGHGADRERLAASIGARVREALDGPLAACP
jgi:hypothetical protein